MHSHIEALESRRLLAAGGASTRFAVIGDYGFAGQPEEDVADLVKGWNPDVIVTTGDNNYPDGAAATIDANIGQYYHDFIYNYQGTYGPGSATRRFLPSLGNHDWNTPGAQPYLDYFDLPGNERYYESAHGPVRFFIIDTDPNEPDGTAATSAQALWLQSRLASASEPYKIVLGHHAPYSSSARHGSHAHLQWPFKQWGATAVITGHDHQYERLTVDAFPYFVNGLGGAPNIYDFGVPHAGSELRFNADHGAMLADADETRLRLKFFTRAGALVDTYTINASAPQPGKVTLAASDPSASEAGADPAVFTFTRTGGTSGALTVNFTIAGSATSGVDYATIPASVTFADGSGTATVAIEPIDDQLVEGDESVVLTLLPDDHYNTGGANTAAATIADDDSAKVTYVALGSPWRFLDDGSNQGIAWRSGGFDDAAWSSGPAQLGYGDGDEDTLINGGPETGRFVTHYFRHTFNVANPLRVLQLNARLLRDDGAVVWLNGHEVWRTNMPDGAINWQTLASSGIGGDDENVVHSRALAPALLVAGTHVLAVELHQSSLTTTDASFDFALDALLDVDPPPPPSRPDLAASSDSGISDNDDVTNDTTPTFTGTAQSGSTVRVYSDAVEVGSGVASNGGAWSVTTSALLDGIRTITATVTDIGGNVSAPSPPLQVTIDTTAPTLDFNVFEVDLSPMSVLYRFSEPVDPTFSIADLVVENLTTSTTVGASAMQLVYGAVTIWLQFPGFDRGILPDGDYRATVLAAGTTDVAGNALTENRSLDFHFLQGDANRDRRVNLADFNILASNFGGTDRMFTRGDFNYDSVVNLDDFNVLAGRFGRVLESPSSTRTRGDRIIDGIIE